MQHMHTYAGLSRTQKGGDYFSSGWLVKRRPSKAEVSQDAHMRYSPDAYAALTFISSSPSGLSPPRHRRPRWQVARGRVVRFFSCLFLCSFSFSNKVDLGILFIFFLPVVSMVATLGGDQAPVCCCSFSPELLSKKALFLPFPSVVTCRGGGSWPARSLAAEQEEGAGDGPGCVVLCCLVPGGPPIMGDFATSTGCSNPIALMSSSSSAFAIRWSSSCRSLHKGVLPLFGAWLVVDLCGMGEGNYGYHQEDGAFHHDILRGGTFEASSWNFQKSISNFVSKMMAVLEVKQQFVATTAIHIPSLRCVAVMVVVRSSDSVCLGILGGDVEANVLYCHMASMQINGTVIQSTEQDLSKNCSRTSCICLSLPDDRHVEDAVSKLFGLCHRRWTTTPPLLILRFNSGDALSLSSVKAIRDLQLNSTPRVHIPDRPSGEPPAGHQLDAAISNPGCRRMIGRRMVPFVIFSIFFTSLDRTFVVVCS